MAGRGERMAGPPALDSSRGVSAENARLRLEDVVGDAGVSAGDEEAGESEAERREPAGDGTFPCTRCGADLRFKPGLRSLVCPYCSHRNEIPEREEEVEELDFRSYMERLRAEGSDGSGGALALEEHRVLVCGTCGAQPEVDERVTSTSCPFCGSAIVTTAASRRLIKPGGVLPFAVERRQAAQLFRDWIKSRWFAPGDLKRAARIDGKLDGVYVPHWTFDAATVTVYRGKKGVTRTTGTGKNRRTYTKWYSVSGTIVHDFDDVLVRASESLPAEHADELEPWDLQNVAPYEDAYLAGFRSEAYCIDLPEGWGRARLLMEGVIRGLIRRDIGGDRQRILSMKTGHKNVTFKHILLPVWISAYRYNAKTYRFLVNARTGEVRGERPWSVWKIALAVLAVLIVLGVAFLIVNLRGG